MHRGVKLLFGAKGDCMTIQHPSPLQKIHKCKGTESENAPPTKRADLINQLALELHEKHGETYAMPHLRIWARMILNKQHKSKDVPPSFPLFVVCCC